MPTDTLGLNFNISDSTLSISGTPNASGTISFYVTATDTSYNAVTQEYNLTVIAPFSSSAIAFSPSTLPAAYVGTSYSQAITASGGTGTLTLSDSVTSNMSGMNLSISGSTLTISGTPTGDGSLNFTVTATDGNGDVATAIYSLDVTNPPMVVNSSVFLYSNRSVQILGVPTGFSDSVGMGINDLGQVVGEAYPTSFLGSGSHAFSYSNGSWTDLNNFLPSGTTVTLISAEGINDNGQIVTLGSDGHAYLLTPQLSSPTPVTVTLSGFPTELNHSTSGQDLTGAATIALTNANGTGAISAGTVTFSLL